MHECMRTKMTVGLYAYVYPQRKPSLATHRQGCGLLLDVWVSRRTNVSSRSRLEKNCQRLGLVSVSGGRRLGPVLVYRGPCSVSANYVSCPRPIFDQIVQATLIKRTQCERALDAGGSEALIFSYQIYALLNLAIIIFVNFAVFVLILTSKLPVPSPLPSFILNLTRLGLNCNSLYYNLPQSQMKNFRISLLLVLLPER